MKNYILVAIAFCLFGCSKEDPDPTDNIVHLAGQLLNSNMDGDYVAGYWRDGVHTALTNEGIQSETSSLYVDGSSVVIAGPKRIPHSLFASVIWRDGVEEVIDEAIGNPMIVSKDNKLFGVWLEETKGWVINKNGVSLLLRDTAYNFAPMAMAVLGDDIYSSGYSSGRSSSPDDFTPLYAQCWKNEQLIFREHEASNALGIFIHQNDIYMTGQIYGFDFSKACYWKNGKRVDLTDGSDIAVAKSIFIKDTHVYVAGRIDDQAVYWKDGEVINLTSEGTFSMANSVFVKGEDVHVAGYEHGHPAYWKNGIRQEIANHDKFGRISFVVVGSNN